MTNYTFDAEFPEDGNTRIDWPFKEMLIGQTVKLTDPIMVSKGQQYAHTFGNEKKRKFKTRKKDGALFVMRLL